MGSLGDKSKSGFVQHGPSLLEEFRLGGAVVVLWSLYEMWELNLREKIDLTQ